jgi:hypothetical protein
VTPKLQKIARLAFDPNTGEQEAIAAFLMLRKEPIVLETLLGKGTTKDQPVAPKAQTPQSEPTSARTRYTHQWGEKTNRSQERQKEVDLWKEFFKQQEKHRRDVEESAKRDWEAKRARDAAEWERQVRRNATANEKAKQADVMREGYQKPKPSSFWDKIWGGKGSS